MTVRLRQTAARRLGGGRWRVTLVPEDPWPGGAPPPIEDLALHPVQPGAAPPTLEALSPADVGWELAFAGADVQVGAYRLRHVSRDAYEADVRLGEGALEEPVAAQGRSRVVEPQPDFDYTARDFAALQPQLLRSVHPGADPTFQANPVSEAVAVVDELAYLADDLSYRQDALATESHLATCRQRVSAVRHAALLAYTPVERVSARAWVRIEVEAAALKLPKGTVFLAGGGRLPAVLAPEDVQQALADGAV
ncbi:MAG: hypothetical protein M3389_05530, partial [Actinomycetota bacterium]|nr:hypothetical protein [Actinomycetota bacterium]